MENDDESFTAPIRAKLAEWEKSKIFGAAVGDPTALAVENHALKAENAKLKIEIRDCSELMELAATNVERLEDEIAELKKRHNNVEANAVIGEMRKMLDDYHSIWPSKLVEPKPKRTPQQTLIEKIISRMGNASPFTQADVCRKLKMLDNAGRGKVHYALKKAVKQGLVKKTQAGYALKT